MRRRTAFLLVGLLLLCGNVQATTIINGSFEADTYPTWPGYSGQPGNPAAITGWAYVSTGGPGSGINPTTDPGPTYPCCGPGPFGPGAPGVLASPDGGQWAFMQGAGSLSQTLTGLNYTEVYTVSYYDSHRNGDSGPGDTLTAEINGIPMLVTTPSNTVWNARSFTFAAPGTSAVLSFVHGNIGGDQSATLDGVKIVPEPAALALFGLSAFGLFVAARRRRA